MKKLFACVLVAVGTWGTSLAGGYDVYLLIGQSNMSGRGTLTPSNAVPNDRILKFTKDMKWAPAEEPLHFDRKNCGAGLAMSFARKMADAAPGRTIALVPCAVGGTPLKRWCPGGDLYKGAVKRARAALKDGELKGILWHQGCGNSGAVTKGEIDYLALLKAIVDQLRIDLKCPDVPFVAGELPYWRSTSPKFNEMIRTISTKITNSDWVSAEGCTMRADSSDPHFSRDGQILLGQRYGQKIIQMVYSKN